MIGIVTNMILAACNTSGVDWIALPVSAVTASTDYGICIQLRSIPGIADGLYGL